MVTQNRWSTRTIVGEISMFPDIAIHSSFCLLRGGRVANPALLGTLREFEEPAPSQRPLRRPAADRMVIEYRPSPPTSGSCFPTGNSFRSYWRRKRLEHREGLPRLSMVLSLLQASSRESNSCFRQHLSESDKKHHAALSLFGTTTR
mmetsp:Transcript_31107/g.46205  ORF Transcript_31107/g.46205 Transcript_31107/m.46205 type:complete len:147 (-) Transcript_31107:290-730(-)